MTYYRHVTTQDLGEAAFYASFGFLPEYIWGASLFDTKFKFTLPFWFVWYRNTIGFVQYKTLLGWRKNLKNNTKQHFGLPYRYTNRKATGFKFADVAVIR